MLYIDGIMMKHLKNELNSLLSGKKIGKIYQYDNNTISIFFGKPCLTAETLEGVARFLANFFY